MGEINKIFGVKEPVSITKFINPERQSMEQTEQYAVKQVINTKEGTVEKTPVADNDIVNKAYADSIAGGAPEGTAVKSTGEVGGTKYLREDGDGTCSWQEVTHPAQVEDSITDGHTTIAPSGNAVFDALALKAPLPSTRYLAPYYYSLAGVSQVAVVGRVYLVHIQVPFSCTATGVLFTNFATVAGNVYVGLYGNLDAEDTVDGADLLATSNNTAVAGANAGQYVDFTGNVALAAGRYYIALEYSNVTNTYAKRDITPANSFIGRYYNRGGGYGAFTNPCPATTALGTMPQVLLRTL